tara:strand:+ start:32659 stop:33213 length:555 start_codon:yes stop_codon:yes gene_type:complete
MRLKDKKIAVLVTDGFEQSELAEPMKAIKAEGGEAVIVSPKEGTVKGWQGSSWGDEFKVDMMLSEADPNDFSGLLLPGGVINPDQLRRDTRAISFIKGFFDEKKQKPVAAICHGPSTLINADVVKGRKMTSYDSIRTDLKNAGANWVDKEVVVDQGLVTSRTPEDLEAFNAKMVEEFCEGKHRI